MPPTSPLIAPFYPVFRIIVSHRPRNRLATFRFHLLVKTRSPLPSPYHLHLLSLALRHDCFSPFSYHSRFLPPLRVVFFALSFHSLAATIALCTPLRAPMTLFPRVHPFPSTTTSVLAPLTGRSFTPPRPFHPTVCIIVLLLWLFCCSHAGSARDAEYIAPVTGYQSMRSVGTADGPCLSGLECTRKNGARNNIAYHTFLPAL